MFVIVTRETIYLSISGFFTLQAVLEALEKSSKWSQPRDLEVLTPTFWVISGHPTAHPMAPPRCTAGCLHNAPSTLAAHSACTSWNPPPFSFQIILTCPLKPMCAPAPLGRHPWCLEGPGETPLPWLLLDHLSTSNLVWSREQSSARRFWTSAPPLTSCVPLGHFLNSSASQFLHLQNAEKSTHVIKLW